MRSAQSGLYILSFHHSLLSTSVFSGRKDVCDCKKNWWSHCDHCGLRSTLLGATASEDGAESLPVGTWGEQETVFLPKCLASCWICHFSFTEIHCENVPDNHFRWQLIHIHIFFTIKFNLTVNFPFHQKRLRGSLQFGHPVYMCFGTAEDLWLSSGVEGASNVPKRLSCPWITKRKATSIFLLQSQTLYRCKVDFMVRAAFSRIFCDVNVHVFSQCVMVLGSK